MIPKTKQSEEQHVALNEKYDKVERVFQKAKLYSNRAEQALASEQRFIASFQFGRVVSDVLWVVGEENVVSSVSKELADLAECIHNEIVNAIVRTYIFTDAESVTCPCNNDTDDMDVYECVLSDLSECKGQAGIDMKRLSDCLLPIADILTSVALIEGDAQAIETSKRIRTILLS